MCGLVGFLRPGGLVATPAEQVVRSLAARLHHRGPDDEGTWIDPDAGVALSHRRLAILDLSPAGHQPMISASGRYVIAYNGEIYNHLELRKALGPPEQHAWRGHSDTETLLAAVEEWGIVPTLEQAVGMFSFALWDRRQRTLTLARDRLGEKPLYYGWQRDVFLFGSELKALRAHPAFVADLDRDALALYMRYGYIPAPSTIYQGVFKLMPGTYMQIVAGTSRRASPGPQTYWSLRHAVEHGASHPYVGTDAEAIVDLEAHLARAVSLQRVADVPLGAFLSGGVDSSTVVALMQAGATRAVKTFTVGYEDSEFSEAIYAAAVAKHLGTDHTELYVTAREALDVIPRMPTLYDEPFGDSSAIPAFLVSSFARRHVTVALSGDGGDELFGGYPRYQRATDIWRAMRHIPYSARAPAARAIQAWRRSTKSYSFEGRIGRLALYLSAATHQECYDAQISRFQDADELVINGVGKSRVAVSAFPLKSQSQYHDSLMYADTSSYLPDDILTKVDRASMAVSLEVRVPMLDHRVLEFAWRLPSRMKVRNREGKWLLKQVLRKYLPSAMVDRPKMGFGIPIGQWLRGPLREWGESLLSEDRLRDQGLLNPLVVRRRWQQHLRSNTGESDSLWQILAFQAWVVDAAADQ